MLTRTLSQKNLIYVLSYLPFWLKLSSLLLIHSVQGGIYFKDMTPSLSISKIIRVTMRFWHTVVTFTLSNLKKSIKMEN